MKLATPGCGGIEKFVRKALTPPSELALANALGKLLRIGALRADDHGEGQGYC